MVTAVGQDDVGRRHSAALYRPGCLAALPWGDEPFDCVVFLCDPVHAQDRREQLSRELARANVDWVQVVGRGLRSCTMPSTAPASLPAASGPSATARR